MTALAPMLLEFHDRAVRVDEARREQTGASWRRREAAVAVAETGLQRQRAADLEFDPLPLKKMFPCVWIETKSKLLLVSVSKPISPATSGERTEAWRQTKLAGVSPARLWAMTPAG